MPYSVVPTGFEDVEEADEVALQIGVWIGYGVTYSGLGCEIDDFVEGLFFKKFVYRRFVVDRHLYESAPSEKGALFAFTFFVRLFEAAF